MIRSRRALVCAIVGLAVAGCSTTYKPIAIDPKTDLYDTTTSVPPGGVAVADDKVVLSDFGAVLLVADSNRYQWRLECVARRALAELGFRNVVNIEELRRWAEDKKFKLPSDRLTIEEIKGFSGAVKPLLVVDIRYGWLGDTQHYGGLRIVDGRSGVSLLTVSHPKGVWMNVDQEVIYPVLNELRKWHRRVTTKSV